MAGGSDTRSIQRSLGSGLYSDDDFCADRMTATPLVVRDASATDAEALSNLCNQLGYPSTPNAMPSRLERLTSDNARALVAEWGGRVVGLATIHLRFTMNREAPLAQLTLLVVDESSRAKGIGRALVEQAEAWAVECGSKRIVVTTALDRSGAHAFYERLSYTHTGRRYAKDFSP